MRDRRMSLLFLAGCLLVLSCPLFAQPFPSKPDAVPGELIVLLAAGGGAPTPEAVVESHRQGRELPAGLAAGGRPASVRFALVERARGRAKELLEADPESPRARLERYLVLTFPANANLDAIQKALERNPHVLHVERNHLFELHVTPSDPLFPVAAAPSDHQWGSHILNLSSAWDYAKGHSYIGVLDTGLQKLHPDLAPFLSGIYQGGNFREHLSKDFGDADLDVDEIQGAAIPNAGHGTHVSGILAATSNNDAGVAGTCWECSLLMAKIVDANKEFSLSTDKLSNALMFVVDKGSQVVNMSLGRPVGSCSDQSLSMFCAAIEHAQKRDVSLVASSGNHLADIQFPASDSRFVAVGGIEPGGAFWDRRDDVGCPFSGLTECGSNYTVTPGRKMQDLVAPASQVLSTMYSGKDWNAFGCGDSTHPLEGYGLCTGTSMSSPFVSGIAGILRSTNPLLSKAQIRDALVGHASLASNWDAHLGYGIPNASASVQAVLGRANGTVLANRLTPLFVLYSASAGDHLYTTFPQMGAAAMAGAADYTVFKPDFTGLWPDVHGYGYFPPGCEVGPCLPEPGASVYVFTTDRSPNGKALVPLYRMSHENGSDRDTAYAIKKSEIESLRTIGYRLDGIEGYIYERCTPEPNCIPAGAVRLYRRYNASRTDYAIFPESELAAMHADGYIQPLLGIDWIGYAYPNLDGDFDNVIDGFEGLLATDRARADSDCDGVFDGDEILGYPNTDPRIPNSGPGCAVFLDVPVSHWARSFIETIYFRGVTGGCATNPLRYCPDSQLTRAEMAPFLLRAKLGSSFVPPPATCNPLRFADVPCSHWAAPWIEELADQGMTTGCDSQNYCPSGLVDRAQMAAFLLRATLGSGYVPPPVDCNAPRFNDVPCTHWAAPWIEDLARRGITAGCSANSYCPSATVDRASMAVFLVRAFNF